MHYLNTWFKLRQQNETSNKTRVSTYLISPGNTEKAFNFYQKVDKGKFTGTGLQRFGDLEMPASKPPMNETDKNLITHAELTIMDAHVLMATNAPERMGFKVEPAKICTLRKGKDEILEKALAVIEKKKM